MDLCLTNIKVKARTRYCSWNQGINLLSNLLWRLIFGLTPPSDTTARLDPDIKWNFIFYNSWHLHKNCYQHIFKNGFIVKKNICKQYYNRGAKSVNATRTSDHTARRRFYRTPFITVPKSAAIPKLLVKTLSTYLSDSYQSCFSPPLVLRYHRIPNIPGVSVWHLPRPW